MRRADLGERIKEALNWAGIWVTVAILLYFIGTRWGEPPPIPPW